MSNTGLNINKAFREQIESNLALTFDPKQMVPIRKVLRKDNTRVISFMMFMKIERSVFSMC